MHKEQSLQILRFIADSPILQSCQTAAVPEGDYLQKPHGLSHCANSDDMTRDLCVAACCLQNSRRQNPSFLILHPWQDLESDSTTCCQLPTKELEASSADAAFPEFSSLCKKLLQRGSHTEPPAWDSAVFPLPHQSEIVCLVLWDKGSWPSCQLCCCLTSTNNSIVFLS